MKSYVVTLASCAGLGVIALVGCAQGSESDPMVGYLPSAPVEAGTSDDDGEQVKVPPPSNPPDNVDLKSDAGASSSGGSADSGAPDAGVGTDGGTSGGTPACASPNACSGATDLGSVSGDTGADVKNTDGSTSQWFKVRVTENDEGAIGKQLWMTATLVSPPGANFDLFVYVPNSDTMECSTVSSHSTSTSSTDSAQVKFGEGGLIPNGSSDSRTVTIEVRHVSGTCNPSAKWTLKVEGNK